MPDESPIDLDEHAALIAYDVEIRHRDALIKRGPARVEITRDYLHHARRFLEERRRTKAPPPAASRKRVRSPFARS